MAQTVLRSYIDSVCAILIYICFVRMACKFCQLGPQIPAYKWKNLKRSGSVFFFPLLSGSTVFYCQKPRTLHWVSLFCDILRAWILQRTAWLEKQWLFSKSQGKTDRVHAEDICQMGCVSITAMVLLHTWWMNTLSRLSVCYRHTGVGTLKMDVGEEKGAVWTLLSAFHISTHL